MPTSPFPHMGNHEGGLPWAWCKTATTVHGIGLAGSNVFSHFLSGFSLPLLELHAFAFLWEW